MDILLQGLTDALLTEEECNQFISDVKMKGSKLPCASMAEYITLRQGS
jgi:hypothetical protein